MTDRPDMELFRRKAAAAEERMERSRVLGRQMSLLPAEASPADPAEIEPRGPGRPKGSRNKRSSKLRQMLAARGYRMPEDVLAEVAGLGARDETGVELAMKRAEQVLLWAYGGQVGEAQGPQRLAAFLAVFKEQTSAATALLPFGLEKMTPDVAPQTAVALVMPAPQGDAGRGGRVLEHVQDADLAPPPMPGQIEQKQGVGDDADRPKDVGVRTE